MLKAVQFSISTEFNSQKYFYLIQAIQFSISIDFVYTQWNIKTVLYLNNIQFSQTVLIQTIQFSISMQFNSI